MDLSVCIKFARDLQSPTRTSFEEAFGGSICQNLIWSKKESIFRVSTAYNDISRIIKRCPCLQFIKEIIVKTSKRRIERSFIRYYTAWAELLIDNMKGKYKKVREKILL